MKYYLIHCLRLCPALPLVLLLFCSPGREQPVPGASIGRIVSLSPSISRQIDDLGRAGLLAGVTSYDDFRDRGVAIVGTLVQPDFETILLLRPDIVLYSSEDGPVQNIERLGEAGIAMYRFNRNRNFSDICGNFLRLGRMLGREPEARKKIELYSNALDRIKTRIPGRERTKPPGVAFFLSHRPLIAASDKSFIAQVIRDAGGACVYSGTGGAYPLVSLESLVISDPDVIISMAGDDEAGAFFRRLSRDFRSLKAARNWTFYVIEPDTIPYYTPADYVKSVGRIYKILGMAARGGH